MLLLALINLRGVGESVKFNVVLTLVEITALRHRHRRRLLRDGPGRRRHRAGSPRSSNPEDKGLFLAVTAATSIAFFAMVGFEDSVNMVEETKDPERIFPRTMLTGLGIAVHHLHAGGDLRGHACSRPDQIARSPSRGPGAARGGAHGRAGLPDRQGLPVPRGLRGRQHRADQHADGQPAALRHGQPGRAAAHPRQGLAEPPRAVRRDHLLDRARAGADHRTSPTGPRATIVAQPRQHHGAAAARACSRSSTSPAWCCARDGRERSSARPGITPAIAASPARSCRPVGRPRRDRLPDRRRADGHRRRAVGDHLADQPGVRARQTGFRDIEHMDEQTVSGRDRGGRPRRTLDR